MPNDLSTVNAQSSVTPVVIYGPDGRPARLSEAQRTESLLGSYDSYLAASFSIPPFNPDHLLASRGYRILEEQLNLAPARSALNIVRTSVLAKNWEVQPAVSDQSDARFQAAADLANALRYALEHIEDEAGNAQDFRHVIYELLGAVHYGFNVSEINWRYLEKGPFAGKLGFESFAAKPCKQIGFGLNLKTMGVNSITSYTPLTGYDFNLPVEKVLRYTFQPESGLPYGRPIGRVIYKHTWSLDFLMRFWNIALEMFGTPFILGKAPPGAIGLARQALAQIRQGAPAVLPTGVDAQLIQVAAGGLSGFNDALQYHGEQCALAYLGNTLTTGTTGGTNTNALGEVHQDTQDYGLGYVRADLEGVLNLQLVARWVRYNYGEEFLDIAPRLSLGQWDAVDSANLTKAFTGLIKSKVLYEGEPVVRDRLKLPPASPDHQKILDERRSQPDPATAPVNTPGSQGDNTKGD